VHESLGAVCQRARPHWGCHHGALYARGVVAAEHNLTLVLCQHQGEDAVRQHIALRLRHPRLVRQGPEERKGHAPKRRGGEPHAQDTVGLGPVVALAVRDAPEARADIVLPELHHILGHESRQGCIVEVLHLRFGARSLRFAVWGLGSGSVRRSHEPVLVIFQGFACRVWVGRGGRKFHLAPEDEGSEKRILVRGAGSIMQEWRGRVRGDRDQGWWMIGRGIFPERECKSGRGVSERREEGP
jgi:hypothetical protein